MRRIVEFKLCTKRRIRYQQRLPVYQVSGTLDTHKHVAGSREWSAIGAAWSQTFIACLDDRLYHDGANDNDSYTNNDAAHG
jgi:hypothetical protein